jgi:hypothetical protein
MHLLLAQTKRLKNSERFPKAFLSAYNAEMKILPAKILGSLWDHET